MELNPKDNKVYLKPAEQGGELFPLPSPMDVEVALGQAFLQLDIISQKHSEAVEEQIQDMSFPAPNFATAEEARLYFQERMSPPLLGRVVVMQNIVDLCAPHVGDLIEKRLGQAGN